MRTPESAVKKQVVSFLKEFDAYFFYPVTGGYGRSGVPDIVCCWRGRFIGIECKANGNKPTQLQLKNLHDIYKQGGIAVIVDESGIGMLYTLLVSWEESGLPDAAHIVELSRVASETE